MGMAHPPPAPPPTMQNAIKERLISFLALGVIGILLFVGAGCLICCFCSGRCTNINATIAPAKRPRMPGAKKLRANEDTVLEEESPWQTGSDANDGDTHTQRKKGSRKGGTSKGRSAPDCADGRGVMWRYAEQAAMRLCEERMNGNHYETEMGMSETGTCSLLHSAEKQRGRSVRSGTRGSRHRSGGCEPDSAEWASADDDTDELPRTRRNGKANGGRAPNQRPQKAEAVNIVEEALSLYDRSER